MTDLDMQLQTLTLQAVRGLALPPVAEVILPEKMLSASESDAKHDKFGLVVLEDGSAGFFYRLLAVEQHRVDACLAMAARTAGQSLPLVLDDLASDDLFRRGIALGAVNAVTTAVFHRAGFIPPQKPPTTTSPAPGEHVGMIGYFRENARQMVNNGHRVSVLEINQTLIDEVTAGAIDGLSISADPASLSDCDVIVCTASTLINGTLQSLLHTLGKHTRFELVGPSAGCFPDPLFDAGVDVMGGSQVVDIDEAIERVRAGKPWRDSVRKCTLTRADYPGVGTLLERL